MAIESAAQVIETAGADERLDRVAIDELHDDVAEPIDFTDVIDRADVRMIEGRGQPRLAFEPALCGFCCGELGQEGLNDYRAFEAHVFGLVGSCLTALPKLTDNAIVRQRLAWREPQHAEPRMVSVFTLQ